jgi:hypothetical protein
MGEAYARPFRRPMLKSEKGVMWSEIYQLVVRIINTVWTVMPPSPPLSVREMCAQVLLRI